MSEVTDIVVPLLQKIQSQLTRLETDMGNLKEDMHHVKVRLTSLEGNVYSQNRHLDNLGVRIERIERRFDLIDA